MKKLWVDDVRKAPEGYIWCKSVNQAINEILDSEREFANLYRSGTTNMDLLIDVIDIDHDAGDFASDGGDFIKLLDWLEARNNGKCAYTFRIHSMNPVGIENMRRIIQRNNWTEIY